MRGNLKVFMSKQLAHEFQYVLTRQVPAMICAFSKASGVHRDLIPGIHGQGFAEGRSAWMI